MIKLIDINRIKNHPENPRKDLGDLAELAESIKQSGVLQNLTLVSSSEGEEEGIEYYALIGNRRLGASKLAGLKEVPCAIAADMDRKTQIATMLLENMQRSDLTVYEQAQGFQMMINLGETVNNISDKTGFSESTVRRRVKLLDLDQDKLKKSNQRGGTLKDYMELEKIECEELRNEVLETVGTDQFNWTLNRAIGKEKEEKERLEAVETLQSFAKEIEGTKNNMVYIKAYYSHNFKDIEIPEDAKEKQYYFENEKYGISLYKEREMDLEQEDKDRKREKKEKERNIRINTLQNLAEQAYKLRLDFINQLSNTKVRKEMGTIIELALYAMTKGFYSINTSELAEIMDIESENTNWEDVEKDIWKQPEAYLLKSALKTIDNSSNKYYNWDCEYRQNQDLDYIYKSLKKLGYRMSEEEKQLQDGTHELFTQVQEGGDYV